MKYRLALSALLLVAVMAGCSKPDDHAVPEEQNQTTTGSQIFMVELEDISEVYVLGTKGGSARKASQEEIQKIVNEYNSIHEYTRKTCCTEDPPPDASIDIHLKNKKMIQIFLRGDKMYAIGKEEWYWIEQAELRQYLQTVK